MSRWTTVGVGGMTYTCVNLLGGSRLRLVAGAPTDFQKLDALKGFDGNQSLAIDPK